MNMVRRETGDGAPVFCCYLEEIMRIRAEPKNYYAKNVTGSTGESVKK